MELDYLAILSAAASSLLLGAVWYSPLMFARPWMAATGHTDESLKGGNQAAIYGGAFLLALVGAAVFAAFLGARPRLGFATAAGFAAGLAWVAGSFAINYLFERRPLRLLFINGGYHMIQYTLFGVILGAFGGERAP